jgi:phytanoyl-CoA hydroxylase
MTEREPRAKDDGSAQRSLTPSSSGMDQAELEGYGRNGFFKAPGLFGTDETRALADYFTAMVERGGDGWAEGGVDHGSSDPLRRYPRLLQPHRGDDVAFRFMVDDRIRIRLTSLLGEEPLAVQTMVYFKPPGAKGQALHQDQRYLRVEPGTCMAAWLALDDCDEENGCLEVVPGSHRLPMLCPGTSDPTQSFTGDQVPIPPGMRPTHVPMKAGDVLFFNGSLIHGSGPNHSPERFRRIIVGHYIVAEAQKVARYYFPVYRMDGSVVELDASTPGGPCGVFRADGELEMTGEVEEAAGAH